jgi:NAD(P)-dependent dehydrogenase (short-subunit alcohol dehydrogenase family)
MSLKDKVAIVTGSARGIGRAIALALAREEMRIVVNSRTQREIEETVRDIDRIGAVSVGIKADISNSEQVARLVGAAVERFGQIDVLVNNAGVLVMKELVDTTEKEWDDVLNINMKGAFLCSRAVLPLMIRQRSGVIVNISSGAGKAGFAELSAYCASKFGLIGLTESLASEVEKYNIRVIALCPGAVATRMQEHIDPDRYRRYKDSMTQPEDVAAKVVAAIKGKYPSGSSVDVY